MTPPAQLRRTLMPSHRIARRSLPGLAAVAFVAIGAVAIVAPSWAQAPNAVRARATIDSAAGDNVTLTTRAGDKMTVELTPSTTVVEIVPIKLEDIKPGSFIGAAAMPQPDGSQKALEVHVFPESMRGTGEGHRPFDLQPQSTMTNGTVGSVTGTTGRTLKVTYQGGEKTIDVPPGTPVVTYEPGTRALLTAGAHVILMGTKAEDGKITATRISVGKNGMVPPM
jgi:hypothetical protein